MYNLGNSESVDFQTWRIIFSDVGEPISVKKIKNDAPRVVPDFPIDGHIYTNITQLNTLHKNT